MSLSNEQTNNTPKNIWGIQEHNAPHAAELAHRYGGIDRQSIYPKMYCAFREASAKDKLWRILDIGCGSGDDAIAFAKMGHNVTAIDPSDLLDIAKEKNDHNNIIYIQDTLPELKSLNGSSQFDGVNMSAVMQYIHPEDRTAALARIASKMKQGARLYMSYPSPPSRPYQYELSIKDLFDTARAANIINAERGLAPLLIDGVPEAIPDSHGRKSIDGRAIVFHNVVFIKSLSAGPI